MAALITLEQAKKLKSLSALTDDEITFLVDTASETIRTLCGRQISYGTYEEIHDGNDRGSMFLNEWPVDEIVTVTIDGQEYGPEYFTVNKNTGELSIAPGYGIWFNAGNQNVVVNYKGGQQTINPMLVFQVGVLAAHIRNLDTGDQTKQSESLGGYSYTNKPVVGDVPDSVKRVISIYKRR